MGAPADKVIALRRVAVRPQRDRTLRPLRSGGISRLRCELDADRAAVAPAIIDERLPREPQWRLQETIFGKSFRCGAEAVQWESLE